MITKSVRNKQRDKLTKASFMMGKAPNFYDTNNKLTFYPMRGDAISQDTRMKAVDANRRTNFISQGDGGFEAPAKKFNLGNVPDKGKADTK